MARKPLDQLSPAYRRRIERAEARGLSRQQARGHTPKEHVARKEREIEKRGLSSSQKRAMKNFISGQRKSLQHYINTDEFFAHFAFRYDDFKNYREKLKQLYSMKSREIRMGTYGKNKRGRSWLEDISYELDVPIKWLYY